MARTLTLLTLALTATLAFAACGGGSKEGKGETQTEAVEPGNEKACNGPPLRKPVKLPRAFPKARGTTYVTSSEAGPTKIVEGFYAGDLDAAFHGWEGAIEAAGYTILFDEKEEHDAEISYRGHGRSGQVALRDECGDSNKIFVHITNRPA